MCVSHVRHFHAPRTLKRTQFSVDLKVYFTFRNFTVQNIVKLSARNVAEKEENQITQKEVYCRIR